MVSMWSRRKVRKSWRSSHQVARVHVFPQKKAARGRTTRSLSSPSFRM
jgi:hypothetical protein